MSVFVEFHQDNSREFPLPMEDFCEYAILHIHTIPDALCTNLSIHLSTHCTFYDETVNEWSNYLYLPKVNKNHRYLFRDSGKSSENLGIFVFHQGKNIEFDSISVLPALEGESPFNIHLHLFHQKIEEIFYHASSNNTDHLVDVCNLREVIRKYMEDYSLGTEEIYYNELIHRLDLHYKVWMETTHQHPNSPAKSVAG